LNPFTPFTERRRNRANAAKLYGAIVAQARLPLFYQGLGVPDTLEGRFLVLVLHLFAVLQRLKAEGAPALALGQELTDRFAADMDTVLREIGVGDLSVPKKIRALAAVSASLGDALERAGTEGEEAVARVLVGALPNGQALGKTASNQLAHYLMQAVREFKTQSLVSLSAGEVRFPTISETGRGLA
jgi:cytochrome b pre-mRNA-processing protein 3